MSGNTGETLTLLAIAGAGVATGGLALAPSATAFSWAGALQGAGAFLSAGSAIMGGMAKADALDAQKASAQLQLTADQAQSAVDEEQRQRALRSVLSTQRAVFGASNIDITSGTASLLAEKTIGSVNTNSNYASIASGVNTAQSLGQISQYRSGANAARLGSYAEAGGTLLKFAGTKYNNARTA